MAPQPRWPLVVVSAFAFVSGAAALVYEIVFTRYLGLFLGHDGYAAIVVVAAFMGGLAIGNALFGRRVDQAPNAALRLYGKIEAGIGIFALAFPFAYIAIRKAFIALVVALKPGAALVLGAKGLAACAILLPPAILMGGTLPVLVRGLTANLAQLQSNVASLYSLNAIGAVFGCLISDFVLIPALGLPASLISAATVNIVIASAAFLCSARFAGLRAGLPSKVGSSVPAKSSKKARVLFGAIALSGFAAMLYEVAWFRVLALTLGSTTHAFSLMLAAFIGGIGLGSWVISRWGRTAVDQAALMLGQVEVALGVLILLSMPLYSCLPYLFGRCASLLASDPDAYIVYAALEAVIAFALMFLPAALLGATLPLASSAASETPERAGADVGRVFAFNTLGAVIGAVVAGLWLMPWLGLTRTFGVGVAANIAAGVIVVSLAKGRPLARAGFAGSAFALAIPFLCGLAFEGHWQRALTLGLWRNPRSVTSYREFQEVMAQNNIKSCRDGAVATVSVNAWKEGDTEQLNLRVNGKPDASTAGDMATQLLLGHLPMLLRLESEDALVIGLGSGITAGAIAQHPTLKHLDVVEISPEVVSAAKLFSRWNHRVIEDPRTYLAVDDARSFVQTTRHKYDAIVNEPSNPWIAGVAGLFTTEFYQDCRSRLKPGGLMVQWVHLYDNSQEALDVTLRTLAEVFPFISVWQSQGLDLILVASDRTRTVDLDGLSGRLDLAPVRDDLAQIGLTRPATLLSRQILSENIGRFLTDPSGPRQRELQPVLEYMAQKAFFAHRDATNWLSLNENRSARPGTLLGRYLKNHSLESGDYRELAKSYITYGLPDLGLLRSAFRRWQTEQPGDPGQLQLAARVPPLGTVEELEALRLSGIRNQILAQAGPNPTLARHYLSLLAAIYRSQCSVYYIPAGGELRTVLDRLSSVDPANAAEYLLLEAELAWDHGEVEACLKASRDALDKMDWPQHRLDPHFNATVTRFIEALLAAGANREAGEAAMRARQSGVADLDVQVACRQAGR